MSTTNSIQAVAESAVVLTRDGDQWCATRPDFINLQESLAGFGDTEVDAIRALLTSWRREQGEAHREATVAEGRLENILYDPRPYKPANYSEELGDACTKYTIADARYERARKAVAELQTEVVSRTDPLQIAVAVVGEAVEQMKAARDKPRTDPEAVMERALREIVGMDTEPRPKLEDVPRDTGNGDDEFFGGHSAGYASGLQAAAEIARAALREVEAFYAEDDEPPAQETPGAGREAGR